MSAPQTTTFDVQTILGRRRRSSDNATSCGIGLEGESRPRKRQRTQGNFLGSLALLSTHTASTVCDLVPSLENTKQQTESAVDVAATAPAHNADNTEVIDHFPVPASVRSRIEEIFDILTGRIPLCALDFDVKLRMRGELRVLEECWKRYKTAVRDAGGDLPVGLIRARHKLDWLEVIRDRYRDDETAPEEDESIYWDWHSPEEGLIPLNEQDARAEEKIASKAAKIRRRILKPCFTMDEILKRFPLEKPAVPPEKCDIAIEIVEPPEPSVEDENDVYEYQDEHFLTTTERDFHPTPVQLDMEKRIVEKAVKEWLREEERSLKRMVEETLVGEENTRPTPEWDDDGDESSKTESQAEQGNGEASEQPTA
ncbi:hypothetical protein GLOTRDRAFT_95649 [Gloeophyllum trabeum ATCC 11539]|uniref:Uncharacterized protein n=1 Tax=Gloeophyllum trabeum (strain ATCC 11539 / FP-39264 / Madison 617) TaxID=670483 RepID=S7RF12_GLOTA|nr:uncharacterized protein GLOTRDRAFT_95649 [Gloeophyllum trabeum ATCC 11539]EPQ52825.1 hypothetical protein GLOTRDRAFT_95649 [Gloeophyllum trabeum ATCC 11539]